MCTVKICIFLHRLEKPEGQLTRRAEPQGGHGDPGPTAKPGVTDTLISLVFPALRCNQAKRNFELSICHTERQREGGSEETRRGRGRRGCTW